MDSSNSSPATEPRATTTPPDASTANVEALDACLRLKEAYMKAAASAPHMAKLHEIVAKSAPYGDEDSWSSSECGRT